PEPLSTRDLAMETAPTLIPSSAATPPAWQPSTATSCNAPSAAGPASLPAFHPLHDLTIPRLRPHHRQVRIRLQPRKVAEAALDRLPQRLHRPRDVLPALGALLLAQLAGLFPGGHPRGAQGITAGHVEQHPRVIRAEPAQLLRGLRRLRVLALPRQDLRPL